MESGRVLGEVERATREGQLKSHDLQRGKEAVSVLSLGRKLELCLLPSCAFALQQGAIKSFRLVCEGSRGVNEAVFFPRNEHIKSFPSAVFDLKATN